VISIPKQLFEKASDGGLRCFSSSQGNHYIKPASDAVDWYLTYQKGVWVLMVKETPQIRFHYEEVMKFLDRFI
jgi:hypothetical protein